MRIDKRQVTTERGKQPELNAIEKYIFDRDDSNIVRLRLLLSMADDEEATIELKELQEKYGVKAEKTNSIVNTFNRLILVGNVLRKNIPLRAFAREKTIVIKKSDEYLQNENAEDIVKKINKEHKRLVKKHLDEILPEKDIVG